MKNHLHQRLENIISGQYRKCSIFFEEAYDITKERRQNMIIEILFSEIKDITNLYKSIEVNNSDFGEIAIEKKYLGKEYSNKVLADVLDKFETEKSICYIGCTQRFANEVFEFSLSEFKYRASFTIDTYEDSKARLKVGLEQIEPREEYDMLLEQFKIAIKDRLISDWNRCIWITDKQSEALSTMLYPKVFETENEMRALVNKVLIHYIGIDWIKKIGMEKYDLSCKKLIEDFRRISPQYEGVDDTFFSMTLEKMMEIVKKGKIYAENVVISLDDLNTLENYKDKSTYAMYGFLLDKRKVNVNIWEDIFKQYFDFEQQVITDFIKNRNHIAHNKLLNWNSMQTIKKNVELLRSNIRVADKKFEESVLSEELHMTRDAEQELEREEEEQRILEENYLRDRIEGELGVEILTIDEVLEMFNEVLNDFYTEIYDELYFNPCFSISQQYAIDAEPNEQILFEVQSNAVPESEIEIVVSLYLDGNMDSESLASIRCRKKNEKNINLFKAEIRYHNGSGYEDEDFGGVYLDSASEFDDSELKKFKKELLIYIEEELNPMIKRIATYKTNEDIIPVSDEGCYECDKKGISLSEDFYPKGFCCFCGADNNE